MVGHRRPELSLTRLRLLVAIGIAALVGAASVLVVVLFTGTGDPAARPAAGGADPASVPAETASPAVPVPSPSPSRSAGASPTASATRKVGGTRIPGAVVNLTNWKLTLPIPRSGSAKAQEILQPQLASYTIAPYFIVNSTGDGVVFQANAGGATTSGSGYPRSELREMTGGGTQEAAWSPMSGTSTMTVRAAVTHLTTVKPQVTVAQIHDSGDDVLVIRLDGPHHLYAEHNGTNYGDLDNNYQLGTPFTAQMSASGGHIRISYHGVQKVDVPANGSGYYFKAGCYTQSNTDKGDAPSAYAQVVIYRLDVTHS